MSCCKKERNTTQEVTSRNPEPKSAEAPVGDRAAKSGCGCGPSAAPAPKATEQAKSGCCSDC